MEDTEHEQVEQYVLHTERLAVMGHASVALAHEIKDPLQAIGSHLELVLDFALEPDRREEYLRFCSQEVEHLTEITERVLSSARLTETGEVLAPASIASLLQQTLALASHSQQLARIQVTTDFPADLPPVLVLPDRIVQALFSLMVNASEVMPEGGRMHITAQADGGTVVLGGRAISPEGQRDDKRVIFTITLPVSNPVPANG
ncbi:MAG: hypothetical protein SXV54_22480 [Chloroflexota bacterium]|nr:hypothetical protein [Chloroflexota bacterium]